MSARASINPRQFGWLGLALGVSVLLGIFPYLGFNEFVLHNIVLIFVYIGLASAWNIPMYGGQLSLGHAAFFGLGAYTSTLLFLDLGVNPWLGMLAAIAVSLAAALVISIPLVRLRGPFFTLATLAFVEVLRLLAIHWRDLTRGSEGVTIPFDPGWQTLSFTSTTGYYYVLLVAAALTVGTSWLIRRSRLGYHLRALATDDEAVRALGVKPGPTQVAALLISAALTSVFGVLFAQYSYVVDPDTVFSATEFSIQPALAGIIGGMGTVVGPVIGAVLLTPLGEALRAWFVGDQQGLSLLIYGIVLLVVVRTMPGGLVAGLSGLGASLRPRITGRGSSRGLKKQPEGDDDGTA